MVGTVKWSSREQGQGFIAVDRGQDVFVHFRAVQDGGLSDLKPGQRVEFDAVRSGLQGYIIALVEPGDPAGTGPGAER